MISRTIALIAMLNFGFVTISSAQTDTIAIDSTAYLDSVTIAVTYDSLQITNYKSQVLELINYLEYNLNLLGSDTVPAKEKDIIINNSYLKLFKDSEVQIEDDLDDKRVIVTNKDAQAYLKDIHFFFKKVKIEFDVSEVTAKLTKDNQLYFKVTLNRNLKGVSIKDKPIESNLTRYVEVNLDERNQDLKIASIYSTGLSVEEDLLIWFNELQKEWKDYFSNEIMISNSVSFADMLKLNPEFLLGDTISSNGDTIISFNQFSVESLKRLITKTSLDLSNSKQLQNLSALKKFSKLQNLDISNSSVTDISDLRNISSLKKLEMGRTEITDINALKYCIDMEELYLNNSLVKDLNVIENFPGLKKLYLKSTPISDIKSFLQLTELEVLQLSNTSVSDLNPLGNSHNLRRLSADSSLIADLNSLINLKALEVISVNNCPITNIDAIKMLPNLKKIYCNGINIDKTDLLNLSIENQNIKIIYQSDELNSIWNNSSLAWQSILKTKLDIKGKPKDEELHDLIQIEKIDIANNDQIDELIDLSLFPKLKELNISGTSIRSLKGIEKCPELEKINLSNTNISDISPLHLLPNLVEIYLMNTSVTSIAIIDSLQNMEKIYASGSPISDFHLLNYFPSLKIIYADSTSESVINSIEIAKNAPYEFIYRTKELKTWWNPLTSEWKKLLLNSVNEKTDNSESLHKIAKLQSINVTENTDVSNLGYLNTLIQLNKISVTKCNLSNLDNLVSLKHLEEIVISNCPVYDISAVQQMPNLKMLTIKNTPIESFKALKKMTALVELNISGSQIKSLKNIDAFTELKVLDISNTYIKKIKEIDELPKLEKFICFNSKINPKDIAELKAKRPNLIIEYY